MYSATNIEALLLCWLIPLEKNPGLRPIDVREILRRKIEQLVVSTIKEEFILSVGSLQICAGHETGCEAAIHAMDSLFKDEMIDDEHAFNSVNREAFIHNIKIAMFCFCYICFKLLFQFI